MGCDREGFAEDSEGFPDGEFGQRQIVSNGFHTIAALLGMVLVQVSPLLAVSGTLRPAPESPFLIGPLAQTVTVGDLNGDGILDLAVSNVFSKNVTLLLGNGFGGFRPAPASPITVSSAVQQVLMGDLNRDGRLDLVIGEAFEVKVFLGNGAGGFTPARATPLGDDLISGLVKGDFNSDGILDLVGSSVNSSGRFLTVWIGDGAGGFTPLPAVPHTDATFEAGDVNGDGRLDLIEPFWALPGLRENSIGVLLGDGSGRFRPAPGSPFLIRSYPRAVAIGDVNGDGRADLTIADGVGLSISILMGLGNGQFVEFSGGPYPIPDVPQSIALGDIDGDGNVDLVVAIANGPNNPHDGVTALFGNGHGQFTISFGGTFRNTGGPIAVAVADFDRDGRLDVVTADLDRGSVSLLLGAILPTSTGLSVTGGLSVGQGVTFNTTVSPEGSVDNSGFYALTGTVSFRDGATLLGSVGVSKGGATLNTTFATAGVHTITATYGGDLRSTTSSSLGVNVTVLRGSQVVSFTTIPNHVYGDLPFLLTAATTSGLPLSFSIVSGPGVIVGNLLTLTGAGTVVVQASQAGTANYFPAAATQTFQVSLPALHLDSVANAASQGSNVLAGGSYAILFGAGLTSLNRATTAASPLESLDGTSVRIADASGATRIAGVFYVSLTRVDVRIPDDLSPGGATLTLTTQDGKATTAGVAIAPVAPGLFTADYTGRGIAIGSVLHVSTQGVGSYPISACGATCRAIPIEVTGRDVVVLSLWGTGFRNRSSLAAANATVGGEPSEVLYAGALSDSYGVDRVDIRLGAALAGRGLVNVELSVDGVAANSVTIQIQ